MVKATLRKPAITTTVTVSPPGQPQQVVTEKQVLAETQVVEVEGVKVECTNTAPPPDHPAPPAAGAVGPVNLEDIVLPLEPASTPEGQNPAQQREATEAKMAVATRPSGAVATTGHSYQAAGVEGEWGADDLKFPQLKLVQGSGPLSTQFDNGTIIYGDLELLPPPSVKQGAVNPAIRFIPVTLTKQFREKLSQEAVEAGDMPRVVNTVQEVEELGGTTRWVGNQMPENFWEPSARCIFLLEKPETSDHPGFALELDGKPFAVAVYYAAGGAFRESAKIIFNTALTSLLVPVIGVDGQPQKTPSGHIVKKPLLWKNVWTLNFAKKQAGNFTPWRPIVKLIAKEETGPEVRAYCDQLVAGSAEAAASGE